MVMGTVQKGGGGCVCPENVMVGMLVSHLLLERKEIVILDMEAGVEHLGRATAKAVNMLIVVVEPGRRSVEVAQKIKQLAADIGLKNLGWIGNKVRDETDREFLLKNLCAIPCLGFISHSPQIIEADLTSLPPFANNPQFMEEINAIVQRSVTMRRRNDLHWREINALIQKFINNSGKE